MRHPEQDGASLHDRAFSSKGEGPLQKYVYAYFMPFLHQLVVAI